ncbi:hypothetical protein MHYP_G00081480 [Metynnis hypsauchen]
MRPNGTPVHSGSRVSPAAGTEGGSSADLSSSLSQSTEDLSQDSVSVLLLSLGGVTSVMELRGEDVVMATEAQSLTPKQLGNQRVMELLAGLTVVQGGSLSPASPGALPAVCMRVEAGPSAGHYCAAAEGAGFLEVCVQGCRAELLASTLNTIGPFLEDELTADPQPIRLRIYNTSLTLKDDGPRAYPTAPQPVPVAFYLDGVVLERLDDGRLTLRPTASQSRDGDAGGQDKACCGPGGEGKVESLQSQLSETRSALAAALSERERLLQEIHKYNPAFTL